MNIYHSRLTLLDTQDKKDRGWDMVSGNQIDLYNLILIVVVVVCSYGLALILTV